MLADKFLVFTPETRLPNQIFGSCFLMTIQIATHARDRLRVQFGPGPWQRAIGDQNNKAILPWA
jgi:hypothetical protein